MPQTKIYAHEEYRYAAPIADELARDHLLREWVLSKTRFMARRNTRVLTEAMQARRSKTAIWWRTNFRICDCQGCTGGRESDIFAVLEDDAGGRFALHIEIKNPNDSFHSGQAERYPIRAACWVTKPSRTILPHADAATVAIVGETHLTRFAADLRHFELVLTFEQIHQLFPATIPLPRQG